MTKEIFVDRGGKVIKSKMLSEYDMIGVQEYNPETDEVIWLVERHEPLYPAVGYAIIVIFVLILIIMGIWCIISLI